MIGFRKKFTAQSRVCEGCEIVFDLAVTQCDEVITDFLPTPRSSTFLVVATRNSNNAVLSMQLHLIQQRTPNPSATMIRHSFKSTTRMYILYKAFNSSVTTYLYWGGYLARVFHYVNRL